MEGMNTKIFNWLGVTLLPSTENPVTCYFWLYIVHHSCLYDFAKTTCFKKIFVKLCIKMLLHNQISRFFKFQFPGNYLRYKFLFLNVVKCSWKLQIDHIIFFGFSQTCPKYSEKIQQYRFWWKICSINVIFWF